jgi:filamentous hemagglutinin family outer membrane protein
VSYDKIDAAFGNPKAVFGKLKFGVRMTKVSEDKIHVVGQAKDLYNCGWLPDYDNNIGPIPPAELSTEYINKLLSVVKGASKESALIAAVNIAYLEQRAGIIKPFKYGIQIDTVI